MALAIEAAANTHTGLSASVVLSGSPSGPLSFWISRVPDSAEAIPSPFTGAGPFIVTVPHPELWYFWAKDNDGFSADTDENGDPAYKAAFCDVSGNPEANEIGHYLSDILWRNKQGIEAILRGEYSLATLKRVSYGFPGEIPDFPALCVCNPRWSWEDFAAPAVKNYTFTFDVAALVEHADEESKLSFATKLAEAAGKILSQPYYRQKKLASGRSYYLAGTHEGNAQDIVIDEDKFGTAASVIWTGQMLIQDTGGLLDNGCN